jgi:hypothetical protein
MSLPVPPPPVELITIVFVKLFAVIIILLPAVIFNASVDVSATIGVPFALTVLNESLEKPAEPCTPCAPTGPCGPVGPVWP